MKHLFQNKLLPVVALEREDDALEVAEVIQRAGLNVMEVPFRTKAASKSINQIKKQHEDFYVGAGTLLKPEQVREAKEVGAQFGLAPGLNPKTVKTAIELEFPFIPGVTTSSEVEQALDLGCNVLKFFPAEVTGGSKVLDAFNGPFAHTGVTFIPMGGISAENMEKYLRLENVIAVGGSWLADKKHIKDSSMVAIERTINKAIAVALNYK